jgi:hypothetical protein
MTVIVVALVVIGAVSAIVLPFIKRHPADPAYLTDESIEVRVKAYRSALFSGTVCPKCLRDNSATARYCAECGTRLEVRSDER